MTPLSILDLAPIVAGSDAAEALRHTLDLAQHAEAWGYRRFWVAEHHNMDGVASSATAVLLAHIAAGTSRIRVGSGGVMLPNHAPLVIAEQFGTLATLHPGRIDLGLGRAPGTDRMTMRALRRHLAPLGHDGRHLAPLDHDGRHLAPLAQGGRNARGDDEDDFPRDVAELIAYLAVPEPGRAPAGVRAIPGIGTQVPVWLLGSSLYSAQLAAYLGLPFAFASHFAPELLLQALEVYRATYRPSPEWPEPHTMVAVNVVAADSDDAAARLLTSIQLRFLGMQRGARGPLPRPIHPDELEALWTPQEKAGVQRMLAATAVGAPATVRKQLDAIVQRTQADELIVAGAIHDHAARLRSYELLAALH